MYAAKVVDGTVTQVIVGDPAWAEARLGGTWVGSDVKVGVGWKVTPDGLRPDKPHEDAEWDDENGWWVWATPDPIGEEDEEED